MSEYLACVAGCIVRDQHYASCVDDTCRGCVERGADVGVLCMRCWRALELAWSEWALLEPFLAKYARLTPRNTDGSRSPAGPSIPLPQTYLAADEVRSWLRSEPQNARSWVSTVEGALEAVGFTRAVQAAARAHQIEERSRRLQRMRCPDCSSLVAWMPPANQFDPVSVRCEGCGRQITEDEQWRTWHRDAEGDWEEQHESALDIITTIEERRA